MSVAIVSAIGIVTNSVSAFMFFRDSEKDLNLKSAFLHLASNAVVSVGLVQEALLFTTRIYIG
jgi:cobalt-zinc-cadmium efflux system protein